MRRIVRYDRFYGRAGRERAAIYESKMKITIERPDGTRITIEGPGAEDVAKTLSPPKDPLPDLLEELRRLSPPTPMPCIPVAPLPTYPWRPYEITFTSALPATTVGSYHTQ
jgi:hypothetical protein